MYGINTIVEQHDNFIKLIKLSFDLFFIRFTNSKTKMKNGTMDAAGFCKDEIDENITAEAFLLL